jgi:hypothetical protein
MVEHGDLRFKQHVGDLYNIPILSIYKYTAYVYEYPFKEKDAQMAEMVASHACICI